MGRQPNIWSIRPLKEATILDQSIAYGGLFVGIALVIYVVQNSGWPENLGNQLFILLAWSCTGVAGYKFLHYYYGSGTDLHEGFFKLCKQVNVREQNLDYAFCGLGSSLFALAFFPASWFMVIAVLYTINAMRCHYTLKRRDYARRLKSDRVSVLDWYIEHPVGREVTLLKRWKRATVVYAVLAALGLVCLTQEAQSIAVVIMSHNLGLPGVWVGFVLLGTLVRKMIERR